MVSIDSEPRPAGTVLLIPVFNDWSAAAKVLARLDGIFETRRTPVYVVIVDDGSVDSAPSGFGSELESIQRLIVLRLRRNLGHQRAIAVGLAFVTERLHPDVVVVMDGDGEDRPEDVPRLLEEVERADFRAVVFAERTKRFDPLWFRFGYQAYRLLHRLATGIPVNVGNFSAVPARHLSSLGAVSELWNHYAAAVFKARLPIRSVPLPRGIRLDGNSKMSIVGLIVHGLSAISVFGEIVGARLLLVLLPGLALSITLWIAAATLAQLSVTAVLAFAVALIVLIQITLAVVGSLFFFLHTRNTASFLPVRDYHWFIEAVTASPERETSIAVRRE